MRRERIGAGQVEHEHAGGQRDSRERVRQVGDAEGLDRYVRALLDFRLDRSEVVVAVILHAVAGEIDEGRSLRPGSLRLCQKITDGAAQRILVQVARADDVKAFLLQGRGDQPGIIGRSGKGASLVLGIPDDERDARTSRLRQRAARGGGQEA